MTKAVTPKVPTEKSLAINLKKTLVENLRCANTGQLIGEEGAKEFTRELSYRLSEQAIIRDFEEAQGLYSKTIPSVALDVAKSAIKSFFDDEPITDNPYPEGDSKYVGWLAIWAFCKSRAENSSKELWRDEPLSSDLDQKPTLKI
jgi:hypothetical protein